MDKINLSKTVYAKNQYKRVINTNFSQLAQSPPDPSSPSTPVTSVSDISVEEFFQYYNQIFFQIPKEGETNSHLYIIKTSSEYANQKFINDEIQALIDEINILQQTNLELNQQLAQLQNNSL